jgi:hypothetical protein
VSTAPVSHSIGRLSYVKLYFRSADVRRRRHNGRITLRYTCVRGLTSGMICSHQTIIGPSQDVGLELAWLAHPQIWLSEALHTSSKSLCDLQKRSWRALQDLAVVADEVQCGDDCTHATSSSAGQNKLCCARLWPAQPPQNQHRLTGLR